VQNEGMPVGPLAIQVINLAISGNNERRSNLTPGGTAGFGIYYWKLWGER
jgi:hypothetical protein